MESQEWLQFEVKLSLEKQRVVKRILKMLKRRLKYYPWKRCCSGGKGKHQREHET
jgi:hypothetical protein